MARKGLPKKYAKMGFKAGWKAYKKAQRARTSGSTTTKKKAVKKTTKKTATRTSGSTRTQPKTKIVYRSKPKPKPKPRGKTMGKRVKLLDKKTFDALTASGIIGVSAVGSTFLINKIPIIKDQKAWVKALTQAGLMVVGMPLLKNKFFKTLAAGFGTGAAISLVIPYLPEGFRFGASGRRFNAEELAELQNVGRPIKITNEPNVRQMGKPVRVGRPVNVTAMGHGYSRGKRGYAAY